MEKSKMAHRHSPEVRARALQMMLDTRVPMRRKATR